MPARGAADVLEAQPEPLGFGPRPRPPDDRDAQPERSDERPPGDHLGQRPRTGRVDDPDADVVGEEARPALDVAGEPEDELGRGGDVDRDRRAHGQPTRPVGAGPPARAHGARSAARKRGSRARSAGTRSPMTRPTVSRSSVRARQPAGGVLEQRGPAEEGLDEPAHPVLAEEPVAHRPLVVRRPPTDDPRACDRRPRPPARPRRGPGGCPRRVNGSRNPAASPTRNQPGPARRDDPLADRRGARDRIAAGTGAPAAGVVGRSARSPPTISRLTRSAPSLAEAAPPARAEDDPDVHPTARDRGDPGVAVAQDDHPGVARRRAVRVVEVEREPDPPGERRPPTDAERPGDHGADPVGSHDDPGAQWLDGRGGIVVRPASLDDGRRPGTIRRHDPGHRDPGPDLRPGRRGQRQERRIEPLPVEPDRRVQRATRRRHRSAGTRRRAGSRPASPGSAGRPRRGGRRAARSGAARSRTLAS